MACDRQDGPGIVPACFENHLESSGCRTGRFRKPTRGFGERNRRSPLPLRERVAEGRERVSRSYRQRIGTENASAQEQQKHASLRSRPLSCPTGILSRMGRGKRPGGSASLHSAYQQPRCLLQDIQRNPLRGPALRVLDRIGGFRNPVAGFRPAEFLPGISPGSRARCGGARASRWPPSTVRHSQAPGSACRS